MRLLENKPMKPFSYFNKGVMATIGRNKAVVDLPGWKFQGTFAWLVWMFIHIMSLVGFRNKVGAFLDWMANYFTYDKPLGLIIRPYKRQE
jgi:NADH dehydrogenase